MAARKLSPEIAAAAKAAAAEAPLLTREQIDRIAAILRGARADAKPVDTRCSLRSAS